MSQLHQHGLSRSLIVRLRDELGDDVRVDLIYDGYESSEDRPLITVEQMQNNFESVTKQREAIEVIYRYQIGLHDQDSVSLSINQERLTRLFLFDEFIFYNTFETPFRPIGVFSCELNAVVPMPADDLSKKSEYNRVYFDVEIASIKRRC